MVDVATYERMSPWLIMRQGRRHHLRVGMFVAMCVGVVMPMPMVLLMLHPAHKSRAEMLGPCAKVGAIW